MCNKNKKALKAIDNKIKQVTYALAYCWQLSMTSKLGGF